MFTTKCRPAVVSLAVAGALTAALAVGASAGTRIQVRANFDHAAVEVSHPGERYLEIEVSVPEGGHRRETGRRPPLNLALVIDKSGSMAEANKLGFVKQAARSLVDRLRPGDRFALVTYDDRVEVPLPSEAFEDLRLARSVIERISAGGATNLGGGLVEGYRQVRRHFNRTGINRVLLLSDGLANRGVTAPEDLSRIAGGAGEEGIELTTFGVGLDFNEDLLAGLAESGRGTYYYIDQAHRIPDLLAREFNTLQRVSASNVVITIEVLPEIEISEILGYEYRREGASYTITLGSLAAGERRRIMARLAPPRRSSGVHRIGRVHLRYQTAGEERSRVESQDLSLRWVEDRRSVRESINRDVVERSTVFEANVARTRAAALVDDGDVTGARLLLEESAQRLQSAPVQSEQVLQEIRESESYGAAISAPMSAERKSAVQKGVKYRSYQTLQQR